MVTGVRQGCILSPFLFLLVVNFMMSKVTEKGDLGVDSAGGKRLVDLDFVDDIRLMPENNK